VCHIEKKSGPFRTVSLVEGKGPLAGTEKNDGYSLPDEQSSGQHCFGAVSRMPSFSTTALSGDRVVTKKINGAVENAEQNYTTLHYIKPEPVDKRPQRLQKN